jgi:hypothetical protein
MWVTGDSVYGDDRRLRMWLESCPQAYVLAVSGKEYVWLDWRQRPITTVLASLPADGWTRLSAGDGTKGLRWYDWRWLPLADPLHPDWRRWLLIRRSVSDPKDLAAYVVYAPQDTRLEDVVGVAGTRWTIESSFEAAKGEVGLDHDEVRRWTGWYRHITLAMWALALLTVLRAGAIAVDVFKKASCPPRRAAAWRHSRPTAGSHPAERTGDSAAPLVLGPGAPADRAPGGELVPVAPLASGDRQVLSLQASGNIGSIIHIVTTVVLTSTLSIW